MRSTNRTPPTGPSSARARITSPTQLSFTRGARYTDDQKDAIIYRATFFGDIVIDNQFVPTSATNTDYTRSSTTSGPMTCMTYLKYATGFKGGGFSPRPANELQTVPFDPEYLETLELGAKSELAQGRVRFNGALFFSEYNDQQTFAQQLDSSGANWFREINAGKADIWGLEAELQAEPVDICASRARFGYVNYELIDNEGNELLFEGDGCNGERCYSPRTPEWTGAVGMQYGFGMSQGGSITPRLDATYQSKIYFTTNNQGPTGRITRLLNGRLTWVSPDNDLGSGAVRPEPDRRGVLQRQAEPGRFLRPRAGQPGHAAHLGTLFRAQLPVATELGSDPSLKGQTPCSERQWGLPEAGV